MEFKEVQEIIQKKYDSMVQGNLFYVTIGRNEIFEQYLSGFKKGEHRQSYNCNCCKSFLRQYGGIVTINPDDTLTSIWDVEDLVDDEFKPSMRALASYIRTCPLEDKFLSSERNMGTKQAGGFDHFFVPLGLEKHFAPGHILATKLSEFRAKTTVFGTTLEKTLVSSLKTAKKSIEDKMYRSTGYAQAVDTFLDLKPKYEEASNKKLFTFRNAAAITDGIAMMRNTSFGEYIQNLDSGMPDDKAQEKYTAMTGSASYRRPVAKTTVSGTEKLKKLLEEGGYLPSLNRRFATPVDLPVEHLLYTYTDSGIKDVFDDMKGETEVLESKYQHVPNISIEDFLKNVVPSSKEIKVLVSDSHKNNFFSLITGEGHSMFFYDNNMSINYTGNVADSIVERVKAAGGSVTGVLRASLSWENHDDLDLHVYEPGGNHISFSNKGRRHNSTGMLDVDANFSNLVLDPVENVTWQDKSKMPKGDYVIAVNNYTKRNKGNAGYVVQIAFGEEVHNFEFRHNMNSGVTEKICTIHFDGKTFSIDKKGTTTPTKSKQKWGIKSNAFHKVNNIMLSPNYWDARSGNKHYLFTLENCVSDEPARPFFNEFIKPELLKDKGSMELLGEKLLINPEPIQVSGLGFSSTIPKTIVAEVDKKHFLIKF